MRIAIILRTGEIVERRIEIGNSVRGLRIDSFTIEILKKCKSSILIKGKNGTAKC